MQHKHARTLDDATRIGNLYLDAGLIEHADAACLAERFTGDHALFRYADDINVRVGRFGGSLGYICVEYDMCCSCIGIVYRPHQVCRASQARLVHGPPKLYRGNKEAAAQIQPYGYHTERCWYAMVCL